MLRMKWTLCLAVLAVTTATAAPAAAIPADLSESANQVLQRESQYTQGLLRGDIQLLESVFADTFVDTSASGKLRDKQQMLTIFARQVPPTSITETDRKIQVYGDTAVVTVKFDVKGLDAGKPYEFTGRATDVWVRRDGQWRCIAAHSSAIQ